jgi:hypothetical protein
MIKKIFISIILTFALYLVSFSQDSLKYQARCRGFGQIRKYTCINLLLKADKTFHFEEVAGDIPLMIENGPYYWNGDTLYLETKELGTIRYLKRKTSLFLQDKTNTKLLKNQLRLDKKKAKT